MIKNAQLWIGYIVVFEELQKNKRNHVKKVNV